MEAKRLNWGVISVLVTLLVVSIVFIGGCLRQSGTEIGPPPIPPPPTTPATPGYVRSYDHQLGLGYDYPEDWEHEAPKVEFPFEKVEVFTKAGEETRIVISVQSTNFKSLAEVKGFGYIDRQSILTEKFIIINDRNAYEVVFKQYPDKKTRWVTFLANDKEYRIECSTTEDLYAASGEIFDYVINSFVIE